MNAKIKDVPVKDVEADEIWGFVGMKRSTCNRKGINDPNIGDAYTLLESNATQS